MTLENGTHVNAKTNDGQNAAVCGGVEGCRHRGNPSSGYVLCLETPIGYISLHPLFSLDERRGWLNLIVFPSRF